MAQGKNDKHQRKGQKKKVIDPLTRKEWFELRAPAPFAAKSFGYTCANKSAGQKKVEDSIMGRVVTQTQADLAPEQESFAWRKVKLIVDQVEGKQALTTFYGLDTTRDELASLVKKRKTMIESVQEVKTSEGYLLRIFAVCFTKESQFQKKRTNYALASQVKAIRRRMVNIIAEYVAKAHNINNLLSNFANNLIEKKILEEASKIYPLKDIKIRKVKVLQRPKIDRSKLEEMHNPEKRKLTKADKKTTIKGKKVINVDDSTNLLSKNE